MVAFTAASGKEDELAAYQAGCDGFIRKPIDIHTIGARLREFLGGKPEAGQSEARPADPDPARTPPPAPKPLALAGPEMEALRRAFLSGAMREVRRILEFLNSGLDTAAVSRLFHQWIGSAGALGYSEIAEQARRAETLLSTANWSRNDLRDTLKELAVLLAAPPAAIEAAIPGFILQRLAGKRIGLIGFADEDADRICAALEKTGGIPYLFPADEPAESDFVRNCAVVAVHVRPATLRSPWLQPEFEVSPGVALVLAGGREDVLALDAEVLGRASEFLIDSFQGEEIVMRLSLAVSRTEEAARLAKPAAAAPTRAVVPLAARPEIIIADDDPNVVAVVRAALESTHMSVRSVSTGSDALRLVREATPQVLVLDVNMPGMDGFEVLAAIDRECLPVRVVMLTARQQERDIVLGFELGADDYIVKPFSPLELVARLKRLL